MTKNEAIGLVLAVLMQLVEIGRVLAGVRVEGGAR